MGADIPSQETMYMLLKDLHTKVDTLTRVIQGNNGDGLVTKQGRMDERLNSDHSNIVWLWYVVFSLNGINMIMTGWLISCMLTKGGLS